MKDYIGIDVGGTTIKCGIFTGTGDLKNKWEIPTRTSDHGSHIVSDIAQTLQDKYENMQEQAAGIGLGVAGPIDSKGYLENSVNLNWKNCYPAKQLEELVGIPVAAGNDANVAALGEQWRGAGEGTRNMMFITLGTGVGSGVIIDGKIVNGFSGLAGEIGHISVNPEETLDCNCGNRGCLDQMASATGIVRNARRFLEKSDIPSALRNLDLTSKHVGDAALAGDEIALKTLEYCFGFLAKTMASVSHIIDPEVYVIGGGVAKMGDLLVDITEKQFHSYFHLQHRYPAIRTAKLGNDAGMYGAARLAQLMVEKC